MKYILTMLFAAAMILPAAAIERKPADKINPDELVEETLLDVSGGKDHIAFVWYIPSEYWTAVINRNNDMAPPEKARAQRTMKGLTVVAVVQGDFPQVGPIRYYDRNYLQNSLTFFRVDASGKLHHVLPYRTVSGQVKTLIESIAPTLGSAIGSLGDNLQFFVFNDQTVDGKRVIDPCQPGGMLVELTRKDGQKLQAKFEFPLNSLYVPRKCPNGRPAHVSWRYCPWTGKKLPQ
ncbi:MAG: hypothetical protein HPZ91_17430 [Lentisphaeria bacterium]|nr:hypothetical protein [Lentisphaeria bacterium]